MDSDDAPIENADAPPQAEQSVDADESKSLTERLPSPRSMVIGLIGVLAVLSLAAGTLGFWTLRTATNSESFERRVEDLLRNEDVSDALARRVVDEVADVIELDEALDEAVPEPLQPAVDILLAGVRSRVELQLGERLRGDRFVETVGAAAGAAHSTVVDVIEGDALVDGVAVADGEVTVNLLPVFAGALGLLQEIGLFSDADIPELDRGGDADEQRAELSEALGRELPADFGEIVVYTSESLDKAGQTVETVRDILVLARRGYWLLLALGLGLSALAIRMSVDRWRTASMLVAGLFGFSLVTRIVSRRVSDSLPDAVEQPGAKATVEELARGLQQSINDTLFTMSALALLALAATLFVSARYPRPED